VTGSRTRGVLAATAMVLLMASPALAAPGLTIEASLDKTRVAVGEEAQVTIIAEARGVNLPEFTLPSVPGLKAVRVADSQNFSWSNGRLTRASTSIFLVSASAPGRYTIPPIKIVAGATHAQTIPLVLDVGGAATSPAPGLQGGEAVPPRVWGDESLPELFVRFVVDRREVYWNQQVTARFIFYSRERLEDLPMWEVEEARGFWKQPLGEMRRGRVKVGDADYVAYEQDVAYFPTRTGRLTLGPGRVEARIVRRVDAPDPWSFLGLPETRIETVPLQTESLPINVRPLPEGAPAEFRGAVGQLSMDVKVDRFVAHAGEPVTVTTWLRGYGNLNTAGDPDVNATLPLRSFEAPGAVTDRVDGLKIHGERRHEKAFVPEVPGSFAIPPIRFVWFDPGEGRYRSQLSDSIRVRVVPGGEGVVSAGPTQPPAALRGRHGPHGTLDLAPPTGAAALGGGSLTMLAVALIGARVRKAALLDPRRRRREALDSIARSIESLRQAGVAPGVAAGRAASLVTEALGVRYGADVEGRSRNDALQRALGAGASADTIAAARRLLEDLDRLAFAPTLGETGAATLEEAHAFVRRLSA
jgi:hypothetical protein